MTEQPRKPKVRKISFATFKPQHIKREWEWHLAERAACGLPVKPGLRVHSWDETNPRLALRITDKGSASWIVLQRRPGMRNPDVHVIGRYPTTSYSVAKKELPGILAAFSDGKLPREEDKKAAEKKEKDKKAAEKQAAETFGAVVETYVAGELGGLRTAYGTESDLRRFFLGQTLERHRCEDGKWVRTWKTGKDKVWRDRPIAEITRPDVVARLDAIKRASGKHAARHALAAVRKFFNWCAEGERYGVTASPCVRIKDKTIGFAHDGRELRRTRVLDDAELRDVWLAAGEVGGAYGQLVQLLLLTGQRVNDWARARWDEIDPPGTTLTVPAERYKTLTAQEVPLSPMAVTLLGDRGKGFVLSTTGGHFALSASSKAKADLDAKIADRRAQEGRGAMRAWTLHDLRRTVRTRLVGDCDVDAFIAERVIGHAVPGLHKVYDQGAHRSQKREALEKWEARLLSIVEPKPPAPEAAADNVVRLPKKRRA